MKEKEIYLAGGCFWGTEHYQQPLAVEKLPLENYYTAEEYHQDYLNKNPDGYCHLPASLFEFARQAKEKRVK